MGRGDRGGEGEGEKGAEGRGKEETEGEGGEGRMTMDRGDREGEGRERREQKGKGKEGEGKEGRERGGNINVAKSTDIPTCVCVFTCLTARSEYSTALCVVAYTHVFTYIHTYIPQETRLTKIHTNVPRPPP